MDSSASPSNAETWQEQLSAYHDGELSADQRAAVEQRLQSDPEAQQLLAEWEKLRGALHALPQEPVPRDLSQQVTQSSLQLPTTNPATGSGIRRGWVWALAALAAAGLLMITQPEEPAPQVAKVAPAQADSVEPPAFTAPPTAPQAANPLAVDDSLDGVASPDLYDAELPAMAGDAFVPEAELSDEAGTPNAPTPHAPSIDTPSASPAVVVRLVMREAALESNLVDNVLFENGILVQPTPAVFDSNLFSPGEPLSGGGGRFSLGRANDPEVQRSWVDILLVDSPLSPVAQTMSQLNQDFWNCLSIDVQSNNAQAKAPPVYYNDFQRNLADNQRTAQSLRVYSRSGAAPDQNLLPNRKGGRAMASLPPQQQRPTTRASKTAESSSVTPQGMAYKLTTTTKFLQQDASGVYRQLYQLVSQANQLPTSRWQKLGDLQAGQAARMPVVLLCCPAPPEADSATEN